jgi:hypothetical protein
MRFKTFEVGITEELIYSVISMYNTTPMNNMYSNKGGWSSQRFYKPEENHKDLLNQIFDKMPDFYSNPKLNDYWFNINRPNSFHIWHTHYQVKYSGVVYLQAFPNSGAIQFRENKDSDVVELQPKKGLGVVFPATLEHQVLPNLSNEYRVSLVFNFN